MHFVSTEAKPGIGSVSITKPIPGFLFASMFLLRYNGFKQIGIDGYDCTEILDLIEAGKNDTTPLITHRYKLEDTEEGYHIFGKKLDGIIKVAIE